MAAHLGGGAEPGLGSGGALHEVMGGETDPPLRRLQAETLALRAGEPGIGVGFARPQALVEAGEDHHVAGDQPGFEQAENAQGLVDRDRNAHRHVADGAIEEGAVILAAHRRGVGAALGDLVEQAAERRAARRRPEAVAGCCIG